jgi:hypothetical protein
MKEAKPTPLKKLRRFDARSTPLNVDPLRPK